MLKKIIAYEKVLLNSIPAVNYNLQTHYNLFQFMGILFIIFLLNSFVYEGFMNSSNVSMPLVLPIISLWIINMILNGGSCLFETVPVNHGFKVRCIFLLSVVTTIIGYVVMWIISAISVLGIFLSLYIFDSKGFKESPPLLVHQSISMTKGYILMLWIILFITFVGTAVAFIKNKKYRLIGFALLVASVDGFILGLRAFMPKLPDISKYNFLEAFSIMPGANTVLAGLGVFTVVISITLMWVLSRKK